LTYRQGRALGVLFDNKWRTFFDFGREVRDQYSFGAPEGPVDYYLMYGSDPKHVVETYAWLTGPTPIPPLWSLGFQQSCYSYYPESRVIEIADRLRADHTAADAIYLDIDYQDHNRPFAVDTAKFPHFSQMIHELAEKRFHVVAITDLHIAKYPIPTTPLTKRVSLAITSSKIPTAPSTPASYGPFHRSSPTSPARSLANGGERSTKTSSTTALPASRTT
jgi:alpha-glucosidase (family GH31 glycosyl hydrolase)